MDRTGNHDNVNGDIVFLLINDWLFGDIDESVNLKIENLYTYNLCQNESWTTMHELSKRFPIYQNDYWRMAKLTFVYWI